MRQLSRNFLSLTSTHIIEAISWSEDESINDSEIERRILHGKSSFVGSKSSSIPPDNTPVLQSKYPTLDYNINTSTLKDNPLDIVYLKNLLSEVSCVVKDNNINTYLEKWGGRGKKELIKIPFDGHTKYDRFKQNGKQKNYRA